MTEIPSLLLMAQSRWAFWDSRRTAACRRELPDGQPEREYNSYCGTYSFDGQTLITRVDGATRLERVGGDQVRRVEFRGERMVLFPPPRPMGKINQNRELVWERIG